MAATSQTGWIWSPPHHDYYCTTHDNFGRPVIIWSQASHPPVSLTPQITNYPQSGLPTEYVPYYAAITSPSFIPGNRTASRDPRVVSLDPSYEMRTGTDAQRFFQVGKVFAMLYTEAAGEQSAFDERDEAYSVVRFGQIAHSSIRRFVVVDTRHGFVYACAISTYTGRGTLKGGCIPSEHAVVYFTNTDPENCCFPGEKAMGMTKDPIEIIPVERQPPLEMKAASRIRFSKQFPIEINVKVKDIGQVHPQHKSKLLDYYRQY